MYKQLSCIPIEAAHERDENKEITQRKYTFKEPMYNSQYMQILKSRLADAQEVSGQDEEIKKLARDLSSEIYQLELKIQNDAHSQEANGKDGKLVTKNRIYRERINEIANKYDEALQKIMEKLELKTVERSLSTTIA